MIVFWLVAAVMIVIALAFVLPPLLQRDEQGNADEVREANVAVYRDQLRELESDLHNGIASQDQYNQDREEIERRLLQDLFDTSSEVKPSKPPLAARNLAYILGAAIPVLAVAIYLPLAYTNERDKVQPPPAAESQAEGTGPAAGQAGGGGGMTAQAIEANVAKLAKRMEENPNDAKGWTMLARSYSQLQRYKDAAEAYEHATTLAGNDADLWAEYAFVVQAINGKVWQGKPTEFINKALAVDPLNPKALIIAGDAATQLKKYDQAIAYWEKLSKSLSPTSPNSTEIIQQLNVRIAEAKRLAKGGPAQ